MHIPDGYLSPSTCATLYAASAPFWYVALRRVKAALNAQTVPLIGVFAAFSFVVMMFNLPLPGGTTGHAVGVGIAAIVLGPAVSILAISMALLIQALFFGDGGITAYGANCFNMAIVGSLVAYSVYTLLAGNKDAISPRRVLAAAMAGYAAINAAAFCAAIEFGVQPLWFHDATGAPLYAPYPLQIAIPAMMLGHLTIAGLAEGVISAGLVSYLQRANPSVLRISEADSVRNPRFAWMTLGGLVLLTPIGILAGGTAWGEWKVNDLPHPPAGLSRLANLWHAPFAEYSPAFIKNASAAYLLSAATGVFLVLALVWFIIRAAARGPVKRTAFIEKTIKTLLNITQETLFAEELAQRPGFLQRLDPRAKLAGIAALITAAVATRNLWVLSSLFIFAVFLAQASRISYRFLATRVWLSVLAFTGVIALPALLLSPTLNQGLRSALFLLLRAETAATLAALLVLSSVWSRLLGALRFLKVPAVAVTLAALTYRYIFVFIQSSKNLLEARQTRLVGKLDPAVERRFATAAVGALFEKSVQLSTDVHTAMQARGFRGEVRLLDDLRMDSRDWWQLCFLLAIACIAVGLGR